LTGALSTDWRPTRRQSTRRAPLNLRWWRSSDRPPAHARELITFSWLGADFRPQIDQARGRGDRSRGHDARGREGPTQPSGQRPAARPATVHPSC
jgi:hypothetical protein